MAIRTSAYNPAGGGGTGGSSAGAGVGPAPRPNYSTPSRGMLSGQGMAGQANRVDAGSPHMVSATSTTPYQAQVGYTPQAPAPIQNPALYPMPYMAPSAPAMPPDPSKQFDINGSKPSGISPIELINQGVDPKTAIQICGPMPANLGPLPPNTDVLGTGFQPLPVNRPGFPAGFGYTDNLTNVMPPTSFDGVGESINSMWNPTAFNGLGQGSGSGQAQMQGMLSQLLMTLRNNAGF